jgi:hypothetical protein
VYGETKVDQAWQMYWLHGIERSLGADPTSAMPIRQTRHLPKVQKKRSKKQNKQKNV